VNVGHSVEFFSRYLRNPKSVGAVLPSSRALAAALCDPYRRANRPSTVLEVGAGTGSVTRLIGRLLGESDRLDICEIQPEFTDILERDVLALPHFASAVDQGRVRLLRQSVQELQREACYDFVLSGLPFTTFNLATVQEIFDVLKRSLKPGGVMSYFEYVGLRRTTRFLSVGRGRDRIREVSAYLTSHIRKFEFDRHTVFQNVPPAYARHLRFDRAEGDTGNGNGRAGGNGGTAGNGNGRVRPESLR